MHQHDSIGPLEILWHDLRFGLRMLIKDRSFAVVAVLTLALGIGANTAIFSVVNGTLIRPLPYPNASRLVMVWESKQQDGEKQNVTSPATFLNWQADNTVFEQIASFYNGTSILTGGDTPGTDRLGGRDPQPLRNASRERSNGKSLRAIAGWEPREPIGLSCSASNCGSAVTAPNPNILGKAKSLSTTSHSQSSESCREASSSSSSNSRFRRRNRRMWTPLTFEPKDHARHGRYLQALWDCCVRVSQLTQAQSSMTAPCRSA